MTRDLGFGICRVIMRPLLAFLLAIVVTGFNSCCTAQRPAGSSGKVVTVATGAELSKAVLSDAAYIVITKHLSLDRNIIVGKPETKAIVVRISYIVETQYLCVHLRI